MLQEIKIRYFNEALQIAIVNWREVYLLKPNLTKLNVEIMGQARLRGNRLRQKNQL
jgi:hypothetical protein